jgi:hypothetical protein
MKTPFWLYVVALVPPAILVAIGAAQPWVPPVQLFWDPINVAWQVGSDCCHLYFGFFSNLAVLMWCSSASVCFFASMLLIQRKADPSKILFMVSAGLFTGLLLFDDLFQAHNAIYPWLFGVFETYIFAAYAIIAGIYLLYFRNLIVNNGYSLMLLSLTLLAISIFADVFQRVPFEDAGVLQIVIEDGAKFIGISTWMVFHFRAAWLLCAGSQHEFQRVS